MTPESEQPMRSPTARGSGRTIMEHIGWPQLIPASLDVAQATGIVSSSLSRCRRGKPACCWASATRVSMS
jgi:hypothetical protein